jgi:hypothetical protein
MKSLAVQMDMFPTLLEGAFPAKTSLFPTTKGKDYQENGADYGGSSPVLLASYDPNTSLWRMCQQSLIEGELRSLETLPRWGMTVNGQLYQLQPLAHLTKETDFGSWVTPVASDNNARYACNPIETKNGTLRHLGKNGNQSFMRLSQMVTFFPTPRTSDVKRTDSPGEMNRKSPSLPAMVLNNAKIYPTPLATDYHYHGEKYLQGFVQEEVGLHLNPEWVEQLMGYPAGWTDLG